MAERETEDTEENKDFRLLWLLNIPTHHLYSAMASYVSWSYFRHLSIKRSTKSSALAVSIANSLAASECSLSASLSASLPELTQEHKGQEISEYKRLPNLGTLRLTWGSSLLIPAGWRIPEIYKLIRVKDSSSRFKSGGLQLVHGQLCKVSYGLRFPAFADTNKGLLTIVFPTGRNLWKM